MDQHAWIERIYEAAVLGERWPALLGALGQTTGARGGLIFHSSQDGVRWTISPEGEPAYEAFLSGGWARENRLRVDRLLARRHAGFLTDGDLMSDEERARSPLFQDFLLPLGCYSGVATAINGALDDTFILSFEGFTGIDTAREGLPLLDPLWPHLARALRLSASFAASRVTAAASVLEQVGLAAAIIGHNRRITYATPRFDAVLKGWLGWKGWPKEISEWLEAKLASLAAGAASGCSRALFGDEGQRALLHLYPITLDARVVFSGALGLLVLITPRSDVPCPEQIGELLEVTPAEARLAHALARGQTLEEAAAAFGISANTARVQLRAVFCKSGLSRQSDLVSLLVGLARG